MKPNLFLVGAAKAGTTSLYYYLAQHPDIYMSSVKEPHYFSQVTPQPHQRRSEKTILDQAEYLALFQEASAKTYCGEASPSYLWDAQAAARIKAFSPDAHILILLRNPIERAYSHYLMDVREGIQQKPFFEALNEDYQRESKGWGISHLYVELGLYCEQVERYLNHFERERILILFYHEFTHRPAATMADINTFLRIAPYDVDTTKQHNPYASPRGRLSQRILGSQSIRKLGKLIPPQLRRMIVHNILWTSRQEKPLMDEEAYAFLSTLYAPQIACLERICGRSVPWKF